MFEKLIEIDQSVFLTINNFKSGVLDWIMIFFSDKFVWIPLYLAVLYLLYIKLGLKKAIIALLAIIITFTLCDQISVLIKNYIQRPRPGFEPALTGMVRVLEGGKSLYGFVSSHAANVFGFAVVTSGLLKIKRYKSFIFIWAIMVSLSRITVGKHYPLDIIFGAMLGVIIAWSIIYLTTIKKENYLCAV